MALHAKLLESRVLIDIIIHAVEEKIGTPNVFICIINIACYISTHSPLTAGRGAELLQRRGGRDSPFLEQGFPLWFSGGVVVGQP